VLNVMFTHLTDAVGRGATVIIPNYYNPYADKIRRFGNERGLSIPGA